jgi:hypothetical protein
MNGGWNWMAVVNDGDGARLRKRLLSMPSQDNVADYIVSRRRCSDAMSLGWLSARFYFIMLRFKRRRIVKLPPAHRHSSALHPLSIDK